MLLLRAFCKFAPEKLSISVAGVHRFVILLVLESPIMMFLVSLEICTVVSSNDLKDLGVMRLMHIFGNFRGLVWLEVGGEISFEGVVTWLRMRVDLRGVDGVTL